MNDAPPKLARPNGETGMKPCVQCQQSGKHVASLAGLVTGACRYHHVAGAWGHNWATKCGYKDPTRE